MQMFRQLPAAGPPFSGPGFLVPHFQVSHFPPLTFDPAFSVLRLQFFKSGIFMDLGVRFQDQYLQGVNAAVRLN